MRIVICLLAISLVGCLSEGGSPQESETDAEPEPIGFSPEPAGGGAQAEWETLVHWRGGSQEFDVLCLFGGGIELRREGPLISSDAKDLFFEVGVPSTMTGYQVGLAIDDGPIQWLDVVPGGQVQNMTVPVPEDGIESGSYRWSFHGQASIPLVEPPCYTGGGQGPPVVVVKAHNLRE